MLARILIVITLFISASSFATKVDEKKAHPIVQDFGQVKFHADYYERDDSRGEIVARGNVFLSYENDSISCSEVRINTTTKDIVALGPVVFKTTGFEVFAEKMSYNFSTRIGVLENAEINTVGLPGSMVTEAKFEMKSGVKLLPGAPKARFRGKRIEKGPGNANWIIYDGEFTNCVDCKIPEWKFTGSKLSTTEGGYVVIDNPVFRVFNLPVGYLPIFATPYDSKRKSGFLAPSYTFSNTDDFTVKGQYYQTLGRSQDLTASWEYISLRGNRPGLEYRYMFADNVGGTFTGYYLHDRLFKQSYGKANRWAARYINQSYFDPRIDLKWDATYISDQLYVRQYPDEFPGVGDASVQSTAILAKHWDLVNLSSDILYYKDITSLNNPLASNDATVQRLPEINGSILQMPFFDSHVTFRMFGGYVNFTTEKDEFEEVNGIQGYQPGAPATPTTPKVLSDNLLRAERFDFRPELSIYTSPIEGIQFIPEFAYQQSFYLLPLGEDDTGEFRYVSVGAKVFGNIERIFDVDWGSLKKLRHYIQPLIRYSYIPTDIQKENIPSIDILSTITPRNILKYSLANYLDLKRVYEDDITDYLRAIQFEVSQSLDIQRINNPIENALTPVEFKLEFYFPYLQTDTQMNWDVYGAGVYWFSTGWNFIDPFLNSYFASFSYNKEDFRKNIKAGADFKMFPMFKAFFNIEYSFDDKKFIDRVYGVSYIPKTQCWRLDLGYIEQFDASVNRATIGLNLIYGIQDGFDRFSRYKKFF